LFQNSGQTQAVRAQHHWQETQAIHFVEYLDEIRVDRGLSAGKVDTRHLTAQPTQQTQNVAQRERMCPSGPLAVSATGAIVTV
jgi:hypothetical protein